MKIPVRNAIEVDEAFGNIGMMILGKMEYKTEKLSKNKVVQRINSCPNLNVHEETETPITSMPHMCQIYSKTAVEELNSDYTLNFSKKMCAGDEYCQYSVELK